MDTFHVVFMLDFSQVKTHINKTLDIIHNPEKEISKTMKKDFEIKVWSGFISLLKPDG